MVRTEDNFPFYQREAREFVLLSDGNNKYYKVKNERTGQLEPVWQYQYLEAGDEFAGYVRRCGYCREFPHQPPPQKENVMMIEHTRLWPERKLRILFFAPNNASVPEIWSPARVVSWKERSHSTSPGNNVSSSSIMEWMLRVEFDSTTGLEGVLRAGEVVQLKGLKNQTQWNGKRGVVSDDSLLRQDRQDRRCPVIIMDFQTQKAKVILVQPNNLERVRTMEFSVYRIEIRHGGVLKVTLPSKFAPTPMLVTFHWVQDLVPTGPYGWSNPDTTWMDPFSNEQDRVFELQSQYQSELETCLAHNDNDDEEKTASLVRMKNELKSCLQNLTRPGSTNGMHEARLLLLTKPFGIALAAMKELALEAGDNIYIFEVLAGMFKTEDLVHFETRRLTREQDEVCRRLALDCGSSEKVCILLLSLFLDVAMAFLNQKDYKKALIHAQGATGDGFLDRFIDTPTVPSAHFLNEINKTFGHAWRIKMTCAAAMGNFKVLNDVPAMLNFRELDVREQYEHWVGTSGTPATDGVSWIEEKYDADAMVWKIMVTKITQCCLGTLDPADPFLGADLLRVEGRHDEKDDSLHAQNGKH